MSSDNRKKEACPKAGPPDESSSANTVHPVDSSANKVGWRKFGTDTPGSRATRGQSVLRMPTYKISLLPPPVSTQGCFFLESKSGRAGKFPGYLENRFANISKKTIKQRKFKKTLPCGPVFVPKVRAGGRDGMLLRQRSGCFRQSGNGSAGAGFFSPLFAAGGWRTCRKPCAKGGSCQLEQTSGNAKGNYTFFNGKNFVRVASLQRKFCKFAVY